MKPDAKNAVRASADKFSGGATGVGSRSGTSAAVAIAAADFLPGCCFMRDLLVFVRRPIANGVCSASAILVVLVIPFLQEAVRDEQIATAPLAISIGTAIFSVTLARTVAQVFSEGDNTLAAGFWSKIGSFPQSCARINFAPVPTSSAPPVDGEHCERMQEREHRLDHAMILADERLPAAA